jgi:hypothetical protein
MEMDERMGEGGRDERRKGEVDREEEERERGGGGRGFKQWKDRVEME